MSDYIIILSLIVAALALITLGIMYFRYREVKKEKNRSLLERIREQDRLARELERACIEKDLLEKLLRNERKEENEETRQ